VQEKRRCVHPRALAQTAKLSEAEHALIVAGVARIHLDHHIGGRKALLSVSMGRLQEGDQQVRRTEFRATASLDTSQTTCPGRRRRPTSGA
jgi:hypothetical protein